MGKKKLCIGGPFGSILSDQTLDVPDRDIYRLRWEFLKLHDGLEKFCRSKELSKWFPIYENYQYDRLSGCKIDNLVDALGGKQERLFFCICFFIYGDIHKISFGTSYDQLRTRNHTENLYRTHLINNHVYPVQILDSNTPHQPFSGHIHIDIDCRFRRQDIIKAVSRLLTLKQKEIKKEPNNDRVREIKTLKRPYYEITEKKWDPDAVKRYLAILKLKKEHPGDWKEKAFSSIEAYKGHCGGADTQIRELNRDLEKGGNIIYWVIRGQFPKTTSRYKK